MNKHQAILANFNNDLFGYHFELDPKIAEEFIEGKDRRVICTINDTLKFHCGIMFKGEGETYINLNKDYVKKLGIKLGDIFTFTLEKDRSEYGMPMPEELGELLAMDEDASKHFHALTRGKQRNLIYIVAKPKTSNTRLNKALAITEFLKLNNGILDFKALNQFFKVFNKI